MGLCSTAAISSPADFIFTNVSHCGTYEACSKWQGIKNKMCFRYTSLFRLVCQLGFVGGRTHLFLHIATYTVSFPFIMIILALKLDSLTHPYVYGLCKKSAPNKFFVVARLPITTNTPPHHGHLSWLQEACVPLRIFLLLLNISA